MIFTDPDGRISRRRQWNVGFWDGHQVFWPKAPCLSGVAMHFVRQVITDMGIPQGETVRVVTPASA